MAGVEHAEFIDSVWGYYREHRRELPWREEPFKSYNILVSEVMLQQTQAHRVVPKYENFLKRFPSIRDLAAADLGDVLREWSGLGYNRRAKYLHDAAKRLRSTEEPWTTDDLVDCKGIGPNTAAAVIVYAYDRPLLFVETNIRTVLLHHFFSDQTDISDKQLLPILEACLDHDRPRDFYYALMDYGTHIKKTVGNSNHRSRHYAKQSKFEGSFRQIRGGILKALQDGELSIEELQIKIADDRMSDAVQQLEAEGLIRPTENGYTL